MSDQWTVISSPIGKLLIAGNSESIREIRFQKQLSAREKESLNSKYSGVIKTAIDQLNAYFRGELQQFDLPLEPKGTDFQRRVWSALRKIPFGETTSYGEIAQQIGSPKASRAVGAANGRNPIPIVIPCHRVIGSNGALTGFGGGLKIKRQLLALEQGE